MQKQNICYGVRLGYIQSIFKVNKVVTVGWVKLKTRGEKSSTT